MPPVPQTLYKYVTPARIDVIENLRICFPPRSAFNDPFDVLPVALPFTETQLPEVVVATMKKHYWGRVASGEKMPPEKDYLRAVAGEREFVTNFLKSSPAWVEQQGSSRLASKIDHAFGILSLTAAANSLLMWAHYADSHQGMVIGLDTSLFKPPSRPPLYELDFGLVDQVHYSKDRPVINWTEKCSDPRIFLTKSPRWRYEREWRVIRKLTDADHQTSVEGKTFHFFSLPPAAIKRVIIGCRMKPADKDRLLKTLAENPRLGHVTVQVASLSPRKFRLVYRDLQDTSKVSQPAPSFPPLGPILDTCVPKPE